ncbi:MAG: methylamine utilization protein [Nitrospinae bacterium]|nr:methylamine utilization protein [Nitrospinota bacterium]
MLSDARKPGISAKSPLHAPALIAVAFIAVLILFGGNADAGEISATVLDSNGAPLNKAVIFAVPVSGKAPRLESGKLTIMDQVNKEFVPLVLAAQTGVAVQFPNRDNIRHHVYSLSPTKTFELPLYIGTPANPVVFDKPGAIAIGCNIHDWMSAYLYVVDTPYFTITGTDGKGKLKDIPTGAYKLMSWHYRMKGDPEASAFDVQISAAPVEKSFNLSLKPEFKAHRAPALSGRGYR